MDRTKNVYKSILAGSLAGGTATGRYPITILYNKEDLYEHFKDDQLGLGPLETSIKTNGITVTRLNWEG